MPRAVNVKQGREKLQEFEQDVYGNFDELLAVEHTERNPFEEFKQDVLDALPNLDKRYALLLEVRLGLNGWDYHSQEDLARWAKVSQGTVSKWEKQAIKALRVYLGLEENKGYEDLLNAVFMRGEAA